MPERYVEAILRYIASRDYQPLKMRQLARVMGVTDDDYGDFRQAVKNLHEAGRIVMGAKDAVMLPPMPAKLVGFYRANPRGFGFVIPQEPNSHGDLFIPPDANGGAMTGDMVAARVSNRGKKDGRTVFSGEIIEIIQRGQNRFVGELVFTRGTWFVIPDGTQMTTPIVVPDVAAAGPKPGSKVVVEILQYGRSQAGSRASGEQSLPTGVIIEDLGAKGQIEVETLAIIRAHGLDDRFSDEALEDARQAVAGFDAADLAGREDLAGKTIVTIDPPDARDFDDAISLEAHADGSCTLGVHIADVSHFVREGTALDTEARKRSTSVYFPRKVLPMLPEILSNGVCSLQEGQRRFCKSAFITYDRDASVVRTRFSESVISSARRLTYLEAQSICDGKTGGFQPHVVNLIQRMEQLARRIEVRRRRAGMLHLDLPEVELIFDDQNKVIDAVPEDTSYSHTVIEMLMVEANEAVARELDGHGRVFLRRIHPDPDMIGGKQLAMFVRACGQKLPPNMTSRDIQDLLARVKGKPESYAVNLAVLKTFQQAEYSPVKIGHFALASDNYCHFTSPIRRYPDLMVHRLLRECIRGTVADLPPEDMGQMVRAGEHCTSAERRAKGAEGELRQLLVLQFLQTRIGDTFAGVITGMTNFGLFVQSPQFLVEGLLRLNDLGDDWWEISARTGEIRGQSSGRKYRLGDVIQVRIAGVDLGRRELDLVLERARKLAQPKAKRKKETRPQPARRPRKK